MGCHQQVVPSVTTESANTTFIAPGSKARSMNLDSSRDLYDRALSVLPGGVNSPVRASYPYPAFIQRGDGAHVIDADGNRYIDYVAGYGPVLLGHSLPDRVIAAIQSQVSDGPMYGAPTEVEVELAEFITRHVPSIEMVRFVNSGTEATTAAVRLARGYTGRDKVVIMQGGYHGAQESTLIEGDQHEAAPSSPGVPAEFAANTIPVPFNDEAAVEAVFEDHGSEIAAVLPGEFAKRLVISRLGHDAGRAHRAAPGQPGHRHAPAGISRDASRTHPGARRTADLR
ncbi:glutamate-1-semialdehyde aminotransferase [Halodesulfurarchaeum formicicum]|uniref:Glutamate-1-semialdehyde 2,1-aminomutase n=1 Tax=Halodesulfurarchaeum formicicum TaxID=1873524 RepID=A0A1D8S1M8_9EURY|nr:glutamate-1-semialdehyde aminotransferase [Halodesulfurarchaeum formicicum]